MPARSVISHNGILAIAEQWRPDYDKPVMGRVVWVSCKSHPCDPMWLGVGWRVEAGPSSDLTQEWFIQSPIGGNLSFSTPLRGIYETGEPIAKPRKRKGQSRPYCWRAGEWTLVP